MLFRSQIFFDPDAYPMSWAWWDGKVSAHHYQEEHGLDTETLMAAAGAEGQTSATGNGTSPQIARHKEKDEESEPITHK